jgi:hypothetical protein
MLSVAGGRRKRGADGTAMLFRVTQRVVNIHRQSIGAVYAAACRRPFLLAAKIAATISVM